MIKSREMAGCCKHAVPGQVRCARLPFLAVGSLQRNSKLRPARLISQWSSKGVMLSTNRASLVTRGLRLEDIGSGGSVTPRILAVVAAIAVLIAVIKKILDTPSRTYDPNNPNVGQSYDTWEQDGILEYYWGEHIHLGYYSSEERQRGYKKKDFKQAKFDFIDEMLRFSKTSGPKRILDVGCGIGGTSRYLARKFPDAQIEGITLSPNQVRRATELAAEQGLQNVSFSVMDALKMTHEADKYDLVWACESGEHMPDKRTYVEEMARVLKPGGDLVIATWCQREETQEHPLSEKDKADLQFLYDEWTHPHFVSKEEYSRLLESTKVLDQVHDEDWTPQTLPTWRHSNWVGVWDPWIVVFKGPRVWYSVIREIVTIERMHRAFARGLMEYGMIRGHKTISSLNSGSVAENINVTTASNGRSGNRVKGKSLSVDSQGSGRTISANFA